jgi:hypothetical protein
VLEIIIASELFATFNVFVPHIKCKMIAGREALALSDMGVVSQSEDPQPEALGSQCLLPRM